MKKLLIILIAFVSCCIDINADNFAKGNDAYREGDYRAAIEAYTKALEKETSAEAYYNLGNAYYRSGEISMALLYFEKAAKLKPGDDDIEHNISIANSKTTDKMPPFSEVFIVKWYKCLQACLSISSWAYIAIASLIIALILFLVYLFMDNMKVRKSAFYCSVLLLVMFVVCNLFAYQRQQYLSNHDTAIIMSEKALVKSSPSVKAIDSFVIHQGTKVQITDREMQGWLGIKLSDGREGWIIIKDAENI